MLFLASQAIMKLSSKLCGNKLFIQSEIPLELQSKPKTEQLYTQERFRIKVIGGGCSGYQYQFSIDEKYDDDDIVLGSNIISFEIVIDKHSLPLVEGSEIHHSSSLGGEHFYIKNPKAKANCGCGNSFST